MSTEEFSFKLEKIIYNLEVIHIDLKDYLMDKELRPDNACLHKISILNLKMEELFIFIHRMERSMRARKKE